MSCTLHAGRGVSHFWPQASLRHLSRFKADGICRPSGWISIPPARIDLMNGSQGHDT